MKTLPKHKTNKPIQKIDAKLNAIYIQRLEKFMALVELSYELKKARLLSIKSFQDLTSYTKNKT